MTDLLTRLQDASEGSRELDAQIFIEVSCADCTDEAYVRLPNHYDYKDGARLGDYWLVQHSGKQLKAAPHYTTSIDAALTLVPEGWGYQVSKPSIPEKECWSVLWKGHAEISGFSVTPTLALCIAALQAQQSKAEVA